MHYCPQRQMNNNFPFLCLFIGSHSHWLLSSYAVYETLNTGSGFVSAILEIRSVNEFDGCSEIIRTCFCLFGKINHGQYSMIYELGTLTFLNMYLFCSSGNL